MDPRSAAGFARDRDARPQCRRRGRSRHNGVPLHAREMKQLLLVAAMIATPAPAETIFVSDEASDCVTAIDGATLKPIECIHVGQRPRGLVASKDGKTLYVAVGNGNAIAIVDTATRTVLRSFP